MSAQEFFSYKAKAEASAGISGKKKCDACLAGMLLFSREFSENGVLLQTENRDTKELFVRLANYAANAEAVTVRKRERSGKPPLYLIKIKSPEHIDIILKRLKIAFNGGERSIDAVPPLSDKNLGAFAAGIFLSCGSVVTPDKGYHLEFVVPTERLCRDLCALFTDRLGVSGKIITRRSACVLYFKESEHIEDILTLIGAQKSSLELMNVKILRDIRNHANRATNCDTANCGRQNRSALRQIEAIRRIQSSDGGLSRLPDELKELAEIRLRNPEMSLSELCGQFTPPLSRSGVNHRFARIERIAEETGE